MTPGDQDEYFLGNAEPPQTWQADFELRWNLTKDDGVLERRWRCLESGEERWEAIPSWP